jgi:hypothetical protein
LVVCCFLCVSFCFSFLFVCFCLKALKTNNQTKEEAKDERWRSKLGKVHLHSISEIRCESDVVLYSYINRRNGDSPGLAPALWCDYALYYLFIITGFFLPVYLQFCQYIWVLSILCLYSQ